MKSPENRGNFKMRNILAPSIFYDPKEYTEMWNETTLDVLGRDPLWNLANSAGIPRELPKSNGMKVNKGELVELLVLLRNTATENDVELEFDDKKRKRRRKWDDLPEEVRDEADAMVRKRRKK